MISNLPQQRTPARPSEINFAPQTSPPAATQNVTMIGHAASGIPASGVYEPYDVVNYADPVAVVTELTPLLGGDCELLDMVVAGINANSDTGNYVPITIVPLASTDPDWGVPYNTVPGSLEAIDRIEAEFVVSPYDGMNQTLTKALQAELAAMSAASRVDNSQFGSIGVVFNRNTSSPGNLYKYDTQFLMPVWMPDSTTSGPNAPAYTLGEMAAAAACRLAAQGVPFNPVDGVSIPGVNPPYLGSDYVTVGYGLESETALQAGWTPLKVLANGTVAFVRTVTARLTQNGSGPTVTAYYDAQDFQVLYYWRRTLWTRFSQPDMTTIKASLNSAENILAEVIRLAKLFEKNNMFQAVDQLAKQFIVERDSIDRSRFNVLTPVNVIPGLHIIANNTVATTQYDSLSI